MAVFFKQFNVVVKLYIRIKNIAVFIRYVNKRDEIVSNPRKMAIHYFKGWFLIDLVAAVPFDMMVTGRSQQEVLIAQFLSFYPFFF